MSVFKPHTTTPYSEISLYGSRPLILPELSRNGSLYQQGIISISQLFLPRGIKSPPPPQPLTPVVKFTVLPRCQEKRTIVVRHPPVHWQAKLDRLKGEKFWQRSGYSNKPQYQENHKLKP